MEPAEEAQAYHCKIKVYNSTGDIEKAKNKLPLQFLASNQKWPTMKRARG